MERPFVVDGIAIRCGEVDTATALLNVRRGLVGAIRVIIRVRRVAVPQADRVAGRERRESGHWHERNVTAPGIGESCRVEIQIAPVVEHGHAIGRHDRVAVRGK